MDFELRLRRRTLLALAAAALLGAALLLVLYLTRSDPPEPPFELTGSIDVRIWPGDLPSHEDLPRVGTYGDQLETAEGAAYRRPLVVWTAEALARKKCARVRNLAQLDGRVDLLERWRIWRCERSDD